MLVTTLTHPNVGCILVVTKQWVRHMQDLYFTTKVATDMTFCDREKETAQLISNIKKNQHTVVIAPRRYGKTSLVCHTLEKSHIAYARVDLFCVVYEEDICNKVAKGISGLIHKMMSFSEKTLKIIEECFKSAYVGFKAGQIEIKAEFSKSSHNPINQLEDLLQGLEKLAQKNNKPMAIFFDEFQDVLKIDETNKIQAVIRNLAQHSKYVTYIFSGSSRVMLNKIFDDKNQPLYMLCSKILLDRIEPRYFIDHINEAFSKRWKTNIDQSVIDNIINYTECHSYYVNLLSDKVWELKNKPTLEAVNQAWDAALIENKGKIIADLEPLNTNRMKVIITVALLGKVTEPNSRYFLEQVKLPLASAQNAIRYLLNYDYLYETPEGIKLVDPLMKKFIIERYQ